MVKNIFLTHNIIAREDIEVKKVVIKKVLGPLGCDNDIDIIWDEKPLGVLKVDEDEIEFEISATQRAIQAEIIDGNNVYRSNAYFVLNGKCPVLELIVSGFNLKLHVAKGGNK